MCAPTAALTRTTLDDSRSGSMATTISPHPRPHTSAPWPAAIATPGDGTVRILGVLGVAGIAMVHLLDAPDTYHSTRYIFWLYIALVCAAVPVTVLLLQWASAAAWLLAAGLAAGPFAGYLLTRSVGLPGDPGDVGNWLDTLGMVSLFIEASVMALGFTRWAAARR
jgi:hypothetical protein